MYQMVSIAFTTVLMLLDPGAMARPQDPPAIRDRMESSSLPGQDASARRGRENGPGHQQEPPRPPDAPPRRGAADDRPLLREITREQREGIIAVLSDLRPLSNEDRRRLSNMDLERFRMLIAQHGPQVLELARLRQSQPEMYRFRIEDFRLVRQSEEIASRLREARKSGRTRAAAELESELRAVVVKQIDLRHQARAREVQLLEERLAEMKRHLAAEQEGRERLIARRITELMEGTPATEPPRDQRRPDGPPAERRGGGGDSAP